MDASEQVSAESEDVISLFLLNREFFVSPGGNQVTADILRGKTIGLYFSANWYSDCLNFTPILASVHNKLKEEEAKFEIVFVSSDENQKSFDEYYATMPWLAIPFSDLLSKKSLTQRFQIEGIPSLIILDPCGNLIQTDGVDLIYRYGRQAFPFTSECLSKLKDEERAKHASQTLEKLLLSDNRNYVVCQKDQVPISSLVGKTVGLFFSAQWCLPCMKFRRKLVSVYKSLKTKKEDFEVVFIPIDKNEAGYLECYQSMPWLALPYGDENVKSLLKYFNIQGIPSLVIIGPDGKTVTKEGRNLINLYAEMAYPFTEGQLLLLQETMDEEAKNYPKSFHHAGHRHVLNLVSAASGGGPYICCECEEQGCGWAYQCIDCGYDIHPKCTSEGKKDNSEKPQVKAGDAFCAFSSVL